MASTLFKLFPVERWRNWLTLNSHPDDLTREQFATSRITAKKKTCRAALRWEGSLLGLGLSFTLDLYLED